jgi:hypothetical protein
MVDYRNILMSTAKPYLSTLAYLGFETNAAISHGYSNTVSFDEVYESLERGTLLEDLNHKLPDEFDFSLFPTGSDQSIGLNKMLWQVAGGLQGRERQHFDDYAKGI